MGLTTPRPDIRIFYGNVTQFALLICIISGHVSFALDIDYLFDSSVLGMIVTVIYILSLIVLMLISRPALTVAVVLCICESRYLFSHYNVEIIKISLSNWDGRFYENRGLIRIFTDNCHSVLRPTIDQGTSFFCDYAAYIINCYAEYFRVMRFLIPLLLTIVLAWWFLKNKERLMPIKQTLRLFFANMTVGKYTFTALLFLNFNLLLTPYYFQLWMVFSR